MAIGLLLTSAYLHAQTTEKVYVRSWRSTSQKLDVAEYEGLPFRVQYWGRKSPSPASANGGMYTRVDKSDGTVGFFENLMYIEALTTEWQRFQINGTFDSLASQLAFGLMAENNGDFYFDDILVEVKVNGQWQPLPVSNPGFEDPMEHDQWGGRDVRYKHFDRDYSQEYARSGNHSLHFHGHDIIGNLAWAGNYVDANGVSLYYETYGEGEPLLMLHGNGQSISAFLAQVDTFAEHYQVILLDSRGRGNSTYDHGSELTYALQAEDVSQFLDAIGVEAAHVVGWSDGGIIGLLMAKDYPEKVLSLVAMGANIFPNGVKNPEDMQEAIEYYESLEGDQRINLDRMKMMMYYPQLDFADLSVITTPTLIMAGDEDVIENMHTVRIFEAIPQAQLAIVPDEGHYLPSQNPELFNEYVFRFLNGIAE